MGPGTCEAYDAAKVHNGRIPEATRKLLGVETARRAMAAKDGGR